jgi:hypothetical protein
MSKHHIRKMIGTLSSIFAHTGHISKDEAKEMSGLDDNAFEEVFEKASKVANKFLETEGRKLDKFSEHFGKEVEDYMRKVVGHLLDDD